MAPPETEQPLPNGERTAGGRLASPSAEAVIQVRNLFKKYGSFEAVRDISFDVRKGEIFGIVGPNGAGKTTTVEIVEGLRTFDSGEVTVLGMHPGKEANRLKQHIGIQLQASVLPDRIRVREALELFSALYERSTPWDKLVETLKLTGKLGAYYDSLSGGQKQGLSIAMALLNDPDIVFFDELTTGLDPEARRTIWKIVNKVRDMGKTVILVTHSMEEAERLCDRLAIINHGELIALDTPKRLIHQLKAGFHLSFCCEQGSWQEELNSLRSVIESAWNDGKFRVKVDTLRGVGDVIHFITDKGIAYSDFAITQPNLEDVFMALVGTEEE